MRFTGFSAIGIVKIDKILPQCTIVQGWKNNFWIEAASFLAQGMVCMNLSIATMWTESSNLMKELMVVWKVNVYHKCKLCYNVLWLRWRDWQKVVLWKFPLKQNSQFSVYKVSTQVTQNSLRMNLKDKSRDGVVYQAKLITGQIDLKR